MRNIGYWDKRLRLGAGLLLFMLAYLSGGAPAWGMAVLGLLFFVTAFLEFCPLWFGLGINTHRFKGKPGPP